MDIKIVGKQIKVTDSMKEAIESKLGKFEHYFCDNTNMKVTVSAKKSNHKIEVTIMPTYGPIIKAEDTELDLYVAIDNVYDKVYKQLRKYKTKVKKYNHQSIRMNNIEEYEDSCDEYNIERRKKISMKPMSIEEAILQMELLGHNFFIFRNSIDDNVNVVYKRNEKGYGLIEEY